MPGGEGNGVELRGKLSFCNVAQYLKKKGYNTWRLLWLSNENSVAQCSGRGGGVMINFIKRAVLVSFVAVGALAPSSTAMAQERSGEIYKTYEKIGLLGTDMYLSFATKYSAHMRTAAILKACSMDGLAKMVEAKIADRQFVKILREFIEAGKFLKLPQYAMLSAQAVANGMVVAYSLGFEDSVRVAVADQSKKQAICNAAVSSSNKLVQ